MADRLGTEATRQFPHWESPCGTVLLVNGDCLEVLPTLGEGTVDAVVTSPPYAMQRKDQYGGVPESEYPQWSRHWMKSLLSAMSNDGSALINIREHVRNGELSDYVHKTRMEIRALGWIEWDELIWHKPDAAPVGHQHRPRRSYERILWFGKSRQGFCSPQSNGRQSKRIGRETHTEWQNAATGIASGIARCTDVVSFSPEHAALHPAPYPVGLAQWMIRLSSMVGGLVLDPFSGSATTGVACIRTGRRFIGIELERRYFDIAVRRCQAELNRMPLFERPAPVQPLLFPEG